MDSNIIPSRCRCCSERCVAGGGRFDPSKRFDEKLGKIAKAKPRGLPNSKRTPMKIDVRLKALCIHVEKVLPIGGNPARI
jgi:hypothetical protein